MMGVVSIGRSLLIRQVIMTVLVVALGGFAYSSLNHVLDLARSLAGGDPQEGAAAIVGAAESAATHILLATAAAAILVIAMAFPTISASAARSGTWPTPLIGSLPATCRSRFPERHAATIWASWARRLQRLQIEALARSDRSDHAASGAVEATHDMRARATPSGSKRSRST